jgi:hypothetical protein
MLGLLVISPTLFAYSHMAAVDTGGGPAPVDGGDQAEQQEDVPETEVLVWGGAPGQFGYLLKRGYRECLVPRETLGAWAAEGARVHSERYAKGRAPAPTLASQQSRWGGAPGQFGYLFTRGNMGLLVKLPRETLGARAVEGARMHSEQHRDRFKRSIRTRQLKYVALARAEGEALDDESQN